MKSVTPKYYELKIGTVHHNSTSDLLTSTFHDCIQLHNFQPTNTAAALTETEKELPYLTLGQLPTGYVNSCH